jgi:NAD dependent epimerase/dehydratase family enzyme
MFKMNASGSGEQPFTWVSLRDAVKAIQFILENPTLNGPVNVCSPSPCTNAEFTKAFGQVQQ